MSEVELDRDEPRAASEGPAGGPQLVDWRRMGRRLGLTATALLVLSVLAWIVFGLATDGIDLGELPSFIGFALGAMFLAELVVVGGSALSGLIRAGEQGERLAGGDVGLLPPQVRRWILGPPRRRDEDGR